MKKTILWSIVVLVSVAIVFSFSIAGCKTEAPAEEAAADEVAAGEEVVIRWTDWQGGNDGILAAYKDIIAIFEAENPGVTVDYQQYTVTTYNEFLKPAISGGTAPDLFGVYPGPDVGEVADAGALRDLVDDIDAEWKGWLGPAYDFKGIEYNGGIWLVPQDVWTECIWYHKDMLEEIGVELKDSTESYSVEDYIAMVEPAKAAGYDVMLAGFIEAWCYFDPYFNFIHQQQDSETPDMVEQAFAGEISWQQDIFRNGFEVFVKMIDAGVWKQDALSMDYQVQAFGDWLERKGIFMWSQGDWFAGSMKPEETFNKNFGTDVGVYAKGEHQDLAIALARLTNSPAAAEIFIANGVNPAAGVDVNNMPEIESPILKEAVILYNSPGRFSEVYYFWPDGVKALGDGIGNVLLGVDSIDEVLANLDEVSGFGG